MKSAVVALAVCTLFAVSAGAQSILVETSFEGISGVIEYKGSATFFTATGFPAKVSLSGNLSLFERFESYAYDGVGYMPWWASTGSWKGLEKYFGATEGACYQSAVVAKSSTISNTQYSGEACIPQRPPREPHYYQLCPLLLDLNGDGIGTTGVEAPVTFMDVNGDGVADATGWTDGATEEGLLWLDPDSNQDVDSGELFGTGMPLVSGGKARNGYEALELYDLAVHGGNGDGVIDTRDAIWPRLRLWIDRDHDGRSHATEVSTLPREHIVQLSLARTTVHVSDRHDNVLMFVGAYKKYLNRETRHELVSRRMADIVFQTID